MASGLTAVAQDVKRPDEDRRKAILALGQIHVKESRDFLVKNIKLRIPLRRVGTTEERLLVTPCRYALTEYFDAKGSDWNAVPTIFQQLNEPLDEDALFAYGSLLKQTIRAPQGFIRDEIEQENEVQMPNAVRIKNLKGILPFTN
jgi:hypothetical protein